MSEKKTPKHTVQYGLVQVSAWEQETEKGNFLNFSWQRSYKDVEGNWKSTQTLRLSDFKDLQLALDDMYVTIRRKHL